MRIGLIGYGYWGRKVARAIARVGTLDVIAEQNPDRAHEALVDWGAWGTHVTSNLNDVLRAVDGVWIATPADSHFEIVQRALDAGCHVLCEKPFVLSDVEAEQLAFVAQAANLVLMAGHLSLYTTEYKTLPGLSVARMTTRRWNTASSFSDHNVLWGLGPHDVATIVTLMGEPDRVFCTGTDHRIEAVLGWGLQDEKAEKLATMELDWLATRRWRFLSVGGTTVVDSLVPSGEHIETTPEPLLVEAVEFARLMEEPAGRMARREEAVAVTRTLRRLQDAMVEP